MIAVEWLNQGLEEKKNVRELNQELEKKNVRKPDLDHEKKCVEERDRIQKNVKLKKGMVVLDLGFMKMIIRNKPNLNLVKGK